MCFAYSLVFSVFCSVYGVVFVVFSVFCVLFAYSVLPGVIVL